MDVLEKEIQETDKKTSMQEAADYCHNTLLASMEELRKTVLEAPGITGQELYKAVSLAGD